jgi:hypothetical protein
LVTHSHVSHRNGHKSSFRSHRLTVGHSSPRSPASLKRQPARQMEPEASASKPGLKPRFTVF